MAEELFLRGHYADFGRISKGGFDRAGRFATVRNAIVERQDIFKRPGVAEGQERALDRVPEIVLVKAARKKRGDTR